MFCRAAGWFSGAVDVDCADGVLSTGCDGAGSESGRLLVDGCAGGSGPGGACACTPIAPTANRVLRNPRIMTALGLVTAHLNNHWRVPLSKCTGPLPLHKTLPEKMAAI